MANGSLMKPKVLQNAPFGAFCKTFDLHLAIIVLKTNFGLLYDWPLKTGFTVCFFCYLILFQSGLVFVDTPGIGENEFLESELMNFIHDNVILGFIYIIKTDNAGGVQEDRVSTVQGRSKRNKKRYGIKCHINELGFSR